MTEPVAPAGPQLPKLPVWPFLVGDLLLLGLALAMYWLGEHPPFGDRRGLAPLEGAVMAACILGGGWLLVTPFLLQYRAWARWAEMGRVDAAVQQIQHIEQIGRLIGSATSSWQAVQQDAARTAEAGQQMMERMTTEARAFAEFMAKANDAERQHLRLEVEKLRRSEADWLQVLVRILDHVYALYQAAVRSGRVTLVEQFSHFQRVCRDAAQRVGVVPVVARQGEPFDPELHQPTQPVSPGATAPAVAETVATGIRFQGRLVRKALVALQSPASEPVATLGSADAVAGAAEETPVAAPSSGTGQTEFTEKLAAGLQASGDTEFLNAMAREVGGAAGPAPRPADPEPPATTP